MRFRNKEISFSKIANILNEGLSRKSKIDLQAAPFWLEKSSMKSLIEVEDARLLENELHIFFVR